MNNKNKIKAYIQYPLSFADSPYYKYLVKNPPKNVIYLGKKDQKGVIVNKKKFKLFDNSKKIIKIILMKVPLPIPNAYLTTSKVKYDLIHCAHCLSLNKNKPWISDIEFDSQMWGGVILTNARKKIVGRILLSGKCKKILPWTEDTKEKILRSFPEIKKKVEVIYPALPLPTIKRKKHKGIKLIFSARYFYAKGGLHALEAIDYLTKKYKHVTGDIISVVPKEVREKYSKNRKIRFYGLMPQKKLFKLYSKADIFIYPGYSDSFGFGFLEAMSFGLPTITVAGYAREEIIENNVDGFIIDRPKKIKYKKTDKTVVNELIKKTSRIIENKKLLKKMSKNCLKKVTLGKFSIKERNKKLRKIYEEALA